MDVSMPLLAGSGLSMNREGGIYKNGSTYDHSRKMQVAVKYQELKTVHETVSSRMLGKAAGVSHVYALKFIKEVMAGEVIDPSTVVADRPVGPGSMTFSSIDEAILLYLRVKRPTRTLDSYRRELYARNRNHCIRINYLSMVPSQLSNQGWSPCNESRPHRQVYPGEQVPHLRVHLQYHRAGRSSYQVHR